MTPESFVTESPVQQLPTTRRAILNLLKRQGPLDTAQVARALSLTPAAVRQQLARLEEDGLLEHVDAVPEGPRRGRPRHVYHLSAATCSSKESPFVRGSAPATRRRRRCSNSASTCEAPGPPRYPRSSVVRSPYRLG